MVTKPDAFIQRKCIRFFLEIQICVEKRTHELGESTLPLCLKFDRLDMEIGRAD